MLDEAMERRVADSFDSVTYGTWLEKISDDGTVRRGLVHPPWAQKSLFSLLTASLSNSVTPTLLLDKWPGTREPQSGDPRLSRRAPSRHLPSC